MEPNQSMNVILWVRIRVYFTISVSIHLSERSKCEAPVHVSARKCHIAILGTQTEVGIRIYAAVSLSIRYEP
jgi:hypothetical protein